MSDFARNPKRGDLKNQQNYLYSIFSKRGKRDGEDYGEKVLKTYLNLKQDTKDDDPLQSRNPVNRLGGVKIIAGRRSADRDKQNYLQPTGDNVFFGMDWEFWKDSLPGGGSTLASNPAGRGGQKRPAQLEWNTVTMAGGRGNNTFNLGNVMDNITNNGLFYNGKASYLISLTHDDIYARNRILNEGMAFGNAFNDPNDANSSYLSTVNLNLQADTTSYEMMIQAADAGQEGVKKNAAASAWLGALGWAQKTVKTPLDLNKEWVDNWAKEKEIKTQRIVEEFEIDWDNLESIRKEKVIEEVEKIPKPSKWITRSKILTGLIGGVFPILDYASSTFSAVKGLYDLFTAKPAKPPKQELKSVFLEAGLQPANKAVVINDWHPNAIINLNIPSFKKSDWNALSISIKKPDSSSSDYRSDGAYVQVGRTTTSSDSPDKRVSTDWPLVIFQNLDKKDQVDQIQNNDGGFAYYTYSFVDPDSSGKLKRGQFNPIRSSSLRMFGRLADTSKLLDKDGKPLNTKTLPDQFVYTSENGFDMRYDAENYLANQDALEKTSRGSQKYSYSKYYFDDKFAGKEGLDANFDASSKLYPFTSNISIEFDSRVHGWYWQPVYDKSLISADQLKSIDPSSLPLDYEKSKLWINNPKDGWVGYSFNELDNNIEAFRYSRLASTFYATSTDKDKDGISDGQNEINQRLAFDRQIRLLEEYGDSLYDIDQRLISSDTNLVSLSQIKNVTKVDRLIFEGKTIENALVVSFITATENDQEVKRKLILHKRDGIAQRALLADDDLNPVPISDFSFNILVNKDDPNQGYVLDPKNPTAPAVRTFAGLYDNRLDKTQLFEYVQFPKGDLNGLTLEESYEAAKARQLPTNLSVKGQPTGILATIESDKENDAITGWFTGKAWLGGNTTRTPFNKNIWAWRDRQGLSKPFWQEYSGPESSKSGPIDGRFSNWASNNPGWSQSRSSDKGLAVQGDSGSWWSAPKNLPLPSGINGFVVEYTPFQGLPTFM